MKKTILSIACLVGSLFSHAQNGAALGFNGNSYIDVGTVISQTNSYTKEAWIYAYASSSNNIISSTSSPFWLAGGQLSVAHQWGGSSLTLSDPNSFPLNVWTHVAVTYDDASNAFVLYVNGVVVATSVSAPAYVVENIHIGAYQTGNFFWGRIDEVRIWDVVRTKCEINTYMNCEIPSSSTGLIANYHFNQGIAGNNNPSENMLTDVSGNSNTGTLNNFNLTGTTSNWITPGAIVSGYTTAVGVEVNSGSIPLGSSFTMTPSGLNTYSYSPNGPIVTPAATSSYTITSTATTGCIYTAISVVIVLAEGLNFDGTDDYVNITSSTNIPIGNSPYTIEAKIKPTTFGNRGIIGWGNYGVSNEVNALRLDGNGDIVNYWWNSDLVVSPAPIVLNDGDWHHIALTYDGTTRKIYVDGIFKGSDIPGVNNIPNAANFRIGSTCPSPCGGQYFDGGIDEVRIWNIARTQCEINTYKDCEIPTTATDLAANYHFNQGNFGADNSTENMLTDASGNLNNGTLTNFNLTGTTSNWIAPGAVVAGYTTTLAPPSITVNNGLICSGNSFTITPGGADTYMYSPNGPIVSPTVTSSYTVTGTVDATACTNTAISMVTVGITDQSVSASITSGICSANSTISTVGSEVGVNYYLRNNSNNSIIEGPIEGTGNPIDFNSHINNTTTYNVFAKKTTLGLNFDGVNDYAVIPASSGINDQFGSNQITAEGWFYPTAVASGIYPMLIGESYMGDGTVKFSMFLNETNLYAGFYDNNWYRLSAPISLNKWQHFACTYDQSELKLYVDGILISSMPLTIALPVASEEWKLGMRWDFPEVYKGKMDEIRLWNVAHTQSELQDGMNSCLTGSESNLVAYYNFEEGNGNTLIDMAGGDQNATLMNSDPSTAWVYGKDNCAGCSIEMTSKPTVTINSISDQTVTASPNSLCVSGTSTISIASSEISLDYYLRDNGNNTILDGPISGTGNALSFTTGTISTTTGYNVLAEKNVYSGVLNFDGSDDYVNIPMNSNLQFGTGDFTFETWINSTSTSLDVFLGSNAGGDDYWMGISNGNLQVSVSGVGCTGTSIINDGLWHHVSGVRQAGSLSVYVDGVLENTISNSNSASPTSDLALGAFGATGGYYYGGKMDEVRIWNLARTQSDIQNNMGLTLTGNESGLVAYYSFEDMANSTTLTDIAGGNDNGTLTNMDVSTAWESRISAECSSQMLQLASVVVYTTTPTITVNSGTICTGQSFTITPSGADTYTYSGGSDVVMPTGDATYSVSGTDVNGCVSLVDAISTVSVNALPTITVNNGTICAGQSFTITPSGADTYTYSGGNDVVMPTGDATYSVSGTDLNGCISNVDAISTVSVNALPSLMAITNNTLLCSGETATLSVTGNATTYTWSTTETVMDIAVSPTATAIYTVEGTDDNGCINSTTISQDVSLCTGVVTLNGTDALITVYPNPNNGLFVIELNTNSQVSITNALGQIIFNETLSIGKQNLNIQNQADGIYFVKVTQQDKQHIIKLIKK